MSEDTLLDVIVKSLNSDDFKKIDPHGYARKIGIIPIEMFDALNQAKHEGLIELEDNDFTVVKLTPFGERVKNVGGWLEFKFLDKSEQKQIKKPKKPKKEKKPKEVIIVAEESTDSKEFDFFISHASEDKDDIVRELAEALKENDFEVWYDEFELKIGDSLRKKIDSGLSKSRFGIVIISPSFVKKNWTEYELNGMVAREMNGHKVILPIWHKVSKDEVLKFSPSLADKMALNTSIHTIQDIVNSLKEL
ncbi:MULTISPECIES: toll/interleukin-1 receptor domain-containing protein [Flavobacterium]|uniref:TIR domain-containing protein n=1 Tax=Flavobacterium hankyongi TaxID=1176532 RepID=A0ABP9A9Z4_9FLAO|nr:toll/interleukin-1 receptor domain-containing protein [Flavobacterium sp. N1846]